MGKIDRVTDTPESRFNGLITLSGRQLLMRQPEERIVSKMRQDLEIGDELARMLSRRGYNAESAHAFLSPDVREHLPDPTHFKDMNKAVERTIKAIEDGEMISIFTDYDADGATAGAIAFNFLKWIGVPATKYVPDRSKEGYGPNVKAMQQLRDEGSTLCLMFDCGTASVDHVRDGKLILGPITVANEIGLDVCVFDHHTPQASLPPAHSIVNPKRIDETTPHKHPAACGMSLMFVIALNSALRKKGFYRTAGEPVDGRPRNPYIKNLFQIAALGTMQDMVELTGLNRLIVHTGLAIMNAEDPTPEKIAKLGYTPEEFKLYALHGVTALRAACGLSKKNMSDQGRLLNEQDLSFQMGPRLNAPGRIANARTSIDLLTMDDPLAALDFAMQASEHNSNRKGIESNIVEQAMPKADEQVANGDPIIIVASKEWDPGVIGIAASRIKEKHERPVIVIGSNEGKWKGSGRSVKSWDGTYKVDLGGSITAALHEGYLTAGGGHPMAGGLSLDIDQLENFRAFMHKRIAPQMEGLPKIPVIAVDAILSTDSVTDELMDSQQRLAPFGEGNPQPLYLFPNAKIAFSSLNSDGKGVSCSFHRMNGKPIKGVAFKSANMPHGKALLEGREQTMHILGHVNYDYFSGKKLQIRIVDAFRP